MNTEKYRQQVLECPLRNREAMVEYVVSDNGSESECKVMMCSAMFDPWVECDLSCKKLLTPMARPAELKVPKH